MKIGKNPYSKIIILLILILVFSVISLLFFPQIVDFNDDKMKLFQILYKIRLAEILIAISVGACLGLSGALMQIILDNPLASPFTLGISSSSAFGAAVSIIIGSANGISWLHPGFSAFCFSLLSLLFLISITSFSKVSKKNIILIGMAVNFFFSSANTLLQYYASPDAVYQITFWITGSLTNATMKDSAILLSIFTICEIMTIFFSKDLCLLQQGEKIALIHGVNVKSERILFLIICSVLASFSVSIVGIIGFIGLVSPHISRLLKLENPKYLAISSSLIGSLFLVVADIFSKSILYPTILPISAITSLIGIPLLLFLLFIQKGKTDE